MRFAKAICGMLCCPPVPSRIASKLMFVPPLPSYDLRPARDSSNTHHELWLPVAPSGNMQSSPRPGGLGGLPDLHPIAPDAVEDSEGFRVELDWLRTRNRNFIPAIFLRRLTGSELNPMNNRMRVKPGPPGDYFTLLFSHGNGTDLGQMFPFFRMLSNRLQCSVYGYEYTGYGASSGERPTELHTTHDIDAAWNELVNKWHVPPVPPKSRGPPPLQLC